MALDSNIIVSFSEPLDAISIGANSFIVMGPGGQLAGKIALFSTTATFTPDASLPALSGISVVLTSGIRDPSGNPLTPNYAWTFVTAPRSPTPP